jgi:hypothetical protein
VGDRGFGLLILSGVNKHRATFWAIWDRCYDF